MILEKQLYRGKFFLETMMSSCRNVLVSVAKTYIDLDYDETITQDLIIEKTLPTLVTTGLVLCDGCMACVEVCPTACLKIINQRVNSFSISIEKDRCVHCSYCESCCHLKVITMIKPD